MSFTVYTVPYFISFHIFLFKSTPKAKNTIANISVNIVEDNPSFQFVVWIHNIARVNDVINDRIIDKYFMMS